MRRLTSTEKTVTTMDVVLGVRRLDGMATWDAVIATTERGHYTAGSPDDQTRDDHAAALRLLGIDPASVAASTDTVTRGMVTRIALVPEDACCCKPN